MYNSCDCFCVYNYRITWCYVKLTNPLQDFAKALYDMTPTGKKEWVVCIICVEWQFYCREINVRLTTIDHTKSSDINFES